MFFYLILICLFVLLLLFSIFMLLFYEWRSLSHRRKCRMLPTPKLNLIFGIALELASVRPEDILDLGKKLRDQCGDIYYAELMGYPQVTLNNPSDIEVVLNSNQCITKGIEYKFITPWLCEGLLVSTGAKWHSRRKMLTPTFHFKILENYLPVLNRNAKLMTRKLSADCSTKSTCIDIDQYVSQCTLDIICETAMGISLNHQSADGSTYVFAIRRIGEIVQIRWLTFWMLNDWLFDHSSTGKEFHKLLKQLHEFTENVIYERKRNYAPDDSSQKDTFYDSDIRINKRRRTFLDCLIEMQRQNPAAMTDKDIREEVDTFMFEASKGHDTTSVAITWALFMIATHLDVQEKVQKELKSIFYDSERDATFSDLRQMQYLEMVIKETLRLYPSVHYFTRCLTNDLKIRHYTIPASTNVAIIPYLVHRNPEIYPDPEKFDPDRFLPHVASSRHPYAFLAFSAGHRNCIGQKFAMLELKVILSTILRKLCIHTTMKKEHVKMIPALVLRPAQKIHLSFRPI